MFTKILFSVVVLLEINFITAHKQLQNIQINELYQKYSTIINHHLEVISGKTVFCIQDDEHRWAAICQQVLIKLRQIKDYEFLYLDYQSFTSTAALSKCKKKREVELISHLLEGMPPVSKHELNMAVCSCRTAIVPKYSIRYKDYTEFVAIIPEPEKQENVLVFLNTKNQSYILSYYYQQLEYSVVNPDLYTQAPPTFTHKLADFHQMYKKLKAVLKDSSSNTHNNIVETSDRYLFARLCLMIPKKQRNPKSDVDLNELCKEKPGAFSWWITINKKTQRSSQLLVYPCSPSGKFIHPSQLNSPTFLLEKGKILRKLYALSPGPNDNSLLVLRYDYVLNDSMELTVTDYIENVSELLLWEIKIPLEFENKCTPN